MSYRSVQQAVITYTEKYEIRKAIQRAQQERRKAKTKESFDFWQSVEDILQSMKPKKTRTFKSKGEWHMSNKMNLNIPAEIVEWIDENKGHRSRAAFIIHLLHILKNK